MEAQEIRYRVNKKVFRQASLYAMFLRNRNTFRVGIAVVLAVAFYTVLAVQGTFPLSYLPIYIAAENERFVREDGVVYRCGEVYRTMVDKTTGNVLSRELLRRNHARVLYDTAGLEIMDR